MEDKMHSGADIFPVTINEFDVKKNYHSEKEIVRGMKS